MRYYPLQVVNGKISATFAAELHAITLFPDDEESIRQAKLVLHDENTRLQRLGAEHFKPSMLAETIMHSADRQVTRRGTCALVALAMVGLDDIGETMSLKRASAVVSEFSHQGHGTTFFNRIHDEVKTSSKPTTGDRKSIESIFREYRSVAHILAAQAALTDTHRPGSATSNALVDRQFLSTVLFYQERLSRADSFESWNAWWIKVDPGSEREKLPEPCLPKSTSLAKLLDPWIAAGKPID